jgi:8-oxo-dGTP pyrophosphatase MutT (NUDIX family)
MPRHREFSCAILIDTDGRFLLQQRENIPTIYLPGMISLFGGHREDDETFDQCIARELSEELSCVIPAERIEHLGSHHGLDIDLGEGTAGCEVYLVRGIPVGEVVVTEGALLIVEKHDLSSLTERLAPIARLAFGLLEAREAAR